MQWFKSYLSGRSQRVRLGNVLSDDIIILFGVPQGSVLGPILFNIYIRSIYNTVKKTGFNIMGYADDHQVYKSFDVMQQSRVLEVQLAHCFLEIQNWMVLYFLQMNAPKTKIIVFGPPNVLSKIIIHGTFLEDVCVRFVSTAKSLGVFMDNNLTFKDHIGSIKKKCLTTIRNLVKIRHLLTTEQLKSIMNSLVILKLDYCNGLFLGINKNELRQMQVVQNTAAKSIFGKFKHDHVDNVINDLHWLTVDKRIVFKVALLMFKTLTGMAPWYLQELVTYRNNGLRSKLTVPYYNSSYGKRAFSVAGPTIWNELPSELKNCTDINMFKGKLKTFLFNLDNDSVKKLHKN